MTKLKKFQGTLDSFLDNLDNLQGMETKLCVHRAYEGEEPIIRLYKGKQLIAGTNSDPIMQNETTLRYHLILSPAYRFLDLLRKPEQKTPLSVADLENVEDWRFAGDGNVCGQVGRYIRGLSERGIVKQAGTHPYGYASWKLATTKGFNVEFVAPKVSQQNYRKAKHSAQGAMIV